MCERARPVSNAVLSTFDPCQVILDCTTLLTLLCKELMVYYVPGRGEGGGGGGRGEYNFLRGLTLRGQF